MTNTKRKELNDLIRNNKINEEILWACLRKLEDTVSECAYNVGKFKNDSYSHNRALQSRNYYINARNNVREITKRVTGKIIPRIIEDVKTTPQCDGLSERYMESVVTMLGNGKYELVEE